jgi:hypothetical protein
MLKKTSAACGLLIAAAAGAIVTSLPAFAEAPALGGCCDSHHFAHFTKNRNWSGSENSNLNRIRLRIHNRNNNVAVARVPQERDNRPEIIRDDRDR